MSLHHSTLYRTLWRWHFYAGLFCLPFVATLAVTGTIYLNHKLTALLIDLINISLSMVVAIVSGLIFDCLLGKKILPSNPQMIDLSADLLTGAKAPGNSFAF